MAKEPKKYSTEELRALYIDGLRQLTTAVGDELRARGTDVPFTSTIDPSSSEEEVDPNLVNLLLGDAAVAYLKTCDEPQSAKQIWRALEKSGRKPDSENPVRSVRWALRKMLPRDSDLIHVGFGTWHLRSKYKSKTKLEKLKAKSAGKGGRTTSEHAERTLEGMRRAKAKGQQIGAKRKMTDEMKERALQMFMEPHATAKSVAAALGVATSSLYGNKVNHQTAKEYFLSKLKAQNEKVATPSPLRIVK